MDEFTGQSGPPEQAAEAAAIPPGVGETGLAVAAIRAQETARPDRLFADPLAGAFVAASGWTPRPAGGPRELRASSGGLRPA